MATLAAISALFAAAYAMPITHDSPAITTSDSLPLSRAVRSSECTKSATYISPTGTGRGDDGDQDCEGSCDCNGLRICSAEDGVCVGDVGLSCTDPAYKVNETMRTTDNRGKVLEMGPTECMSACDCNGVRTCSVFGTCYTPATADEYNTLIDAALAGKNVTVPAQFEGSPQGSSETFFSIIQGTSIHVEAGESLAAVLKDWRRCDAVVTCTQYQSYFRGGVQLCELGSSSDDGYQCTKRTCCKSGK